MSRVQLQVACLEFEEGGHTLWVHGPAGTTILRVKCTGKICVTTCETDQATAHADVLVQGDITFCVPSEDAEEEIDYVH